MSKDLVLHFEADCGSMIYSGVGPEHAHLKDSLRAEYVAATDEEALRGFRMACEYEGIIPALETSHAIWSAAQLAKTMPKDSNIVLVSSIYRACESS